MVLQLIEYILVTFIVFLVFGLVFSITGLALSGIKMRSGAYNLIDGHKFLVKASFFLMGALIFCVLMLLSIEVPVRSGTDQVIRIVHVAIALVFFVGFSLGAFFNGLKSKNHRYIVRPTLFLFPIVVLMGSYLLITGYL